MFMIKMPKVIKPMSRVLIRFMLVICCGWTVTTQGQTLVLHHADGSTTDVKLFVAPKVTFEGEKLHIQSPVVDMQFTLGDVVSYSFKSDDTAVSDLPADASYEQRHGNIVFHGVTSTADLVVYDSRGIRRPVRLTVADGQAVLPLADLPSGVSIISVKGRTAKFIRP